MREYEAGSIIRNLPDAQRLVACEHPPRATLALDGEIGSIVPRLTDNQRAAIAEQLPEEGGSFDMIICFRCHHIIKMQPDIRIN